MNLHGFVAVLGKRKEQKKKTFFLMYPPSMYN